MDATSLLKDAMKKKMENIFRTFDATGAEA